VHSESGDINASNILDKINNGEHVVEYDQVIIKGDLNLSLLGHHLKQIVQRPNGRLSELNNSSIKITNSIINGKVNLSNTLFLKPIVFAGTNFTETADFSGSQFSGDANFEGSHFKGNANFANTQFSDYGNFLQSNFTKDAIFSYSRFMKNAGFTKSQFGGKANFISSQFGGIAGFAGSQFKGEAIFNNATFDEDARFYNATFSQDAKFYNCNFTGDSSFGRSKFFGNVIFDGSQFSKAALFSGSEFSGDVIFTNSAVMGDADFILSKFAKKANFDQSQFDKIINFHGSKFNEAPSLADIYFNEIYIDWVAISQFNSGFDGKVYLSLIESYKSRGFYSDADNCYYAFRLEQFNHRWITDEPMYLFDLGAWTFYGFGKRPLFALIWSAIFIVLFGAIWIAMGSKKSRNEIDEYSQIRKWPGGVSEAIFFSTTLFLSGTKLFVDPPAIPELPSVSRSIVKKAFIAERLLGALFSVLFFIAVTGMIFRPS